jgi:hypothetical protein
MYLCPLCRGFLCPFCDRQGTIQMKTNDLLEIEVAYPLTKHIRLTRRSNKWIKPILERK